MSTGSTANRISARMSTQDQLSPGFDRRILPPQFKSQSKAICRLQSLTLITRPTFTGYMQSLEYLKASNALNDNLFYFYGNS